MWDLIKIYVINVSSTLFFLFFVRIIIIYLRIHKTKKLIPRARFPTSKLLIVLGSGGHTFEMLRLIEFLSERYRPRTYIIAETDHMSELKIKSLEQKKMEYLNCNCISVEKQVDNLYEIEKIPRSREVLQSWFTTVISTLYSCLCSVPIVFKHMPDAILCNGPGTCVPICLVAFLLHVFGIKHIKVIYVESICRVDTLSLTGKILYHLADHFLVQWPQLKVTYPRAKYLGQLV